MESKSLRKSGQVNLCNLISNNGFRLVGPRLHGFLFFIVSVGDFHVKNLVSQSIFFIFDIIFELPIIESKLSLTSRRVK